jgi:hypothetical protein
LLRKGTVCAQGWVHFALLSNFCSDVCVLSSSTADRFGLLLLPVYLPRRPRQLKARSSLAPSSTSSAISRSPSFRPRRRTASLRLPEAGHLATSLHYSRCARSSGASPRRIVLCFGKCGWPRFLALATRRIWTKGG